MHLRRVLESGSCMLRLRGTGCNWCMVQGLRLIKGGFRVYAHLRRVLEGGKLHAAAEAHGRQQRVLQREAQLLLHLPYARRRSSAHSLHRGHTEADTTRGRFRSCSTHGCSNKLRYYRYTAGHTGTTSIGCVSGLDAACLYDNCNVMILGWHFKSCRTQSKGARTHWLSAKKGEAGPCACARLGASVPCDSSPLPTGTKAAPQLLAPKAVPLRMNGSGGKAERGPSRGAAAWLGPKGDCARV